jgi:hypothetical protein
MPVSERFSIRARNHPRVASFPPGPEPFVLAVKDQLLVCAGVLGRVKHRLAARHIQADEIATFFGALQALSQPIYASEDVVILRLTQFPAGENIFDVVHDLRSYLGSAHQYRKVSPNHVLIPALESHGCPHGPPDRADRGSIGQFELPGVAITVIDSGYQWYASWGANPLESRVVGQLGEIRQTRELRIDSTDGWVPYDPEELDADNDLRLDALAGHANFVAGVIARRCPNAVITVRNHKGGFNPEEDDFVTEAAVCLSLCLSGDASVVDVGFAFASLDNQISCVWDLAFHQLGEGTIGSGPVVVAPAGNQHSSTPRYPAALASNRQAQADTGGGYSNMIGVGSIDPEDHDRELFSNYGDDENGDWITCSADGNDVVSTFLNLRCMVEDDDDDPPEVRDFTSCWATWNGTSFSTPKVVAAIANEVLRQLDGNAAADQMAAWRAVRDAGNHVPTEQPDIAQDPEQRGPNSGLGTVLQLDDR